MKITSSTIKASLQKSAEFFHRTFIGRAISRFGQNNTPIFAAGMAFYAIFSLFPLLLVLVAAGSIILEKYVTQAELFDFIFSFFPFYQDWIQDNIKGIMVDRGAVGVIALITLIWSASGYFNILVRGLNDAWPGIKHRNFVGRRLIALAIVGGIILLLILSFLTSVSLDFLSHFQVPMGGSTLFYETFIWKFFKNYFPFVFLLLIFWLLYYFAPNVKVKKRAAFIGALPASIAWNLLNYGFSWFLRSGFAQYEIIYGSLGTIVSLLFWIYLSNLLILFGAYITAAAQFRYYPRSLPDALTK
jgi:membrane protein